MRRQPPGYAQRIRQFPPCSLTRHNTPPGPAAERLANIYRARQSASDNRASKAMHLLPANELDQEHTIVARSTKSGGREPAVVCGNARATAVPHTVAIRRHVRRSDRREPAVVY